MKTRSTLDELSEATMSAWASAGRRIAVSLGMKAGGKQKAIALYHKIQSLAKESKGWVADGHKRSHQ